MGSIIILADGFCGLHVQKQTPSHVCWAYSVYATAAENPVFRKIQSLLILAKVATCVSRNCLPRVDATWSPKKLFVSLSCTHWNPHSKHYKAYPGLLPHDALRCSKHWPGPLCIMASWALLPGLELHKQCVLQCWQLLINFQRPKES